MIPRILRTLAPVGAVAAVFVVTLLAPAAAAAQSRTPAQAPPAVPAVAPSVTDENARETRDRLRELLDQYPPSLAQVLRLDPSLVSRSDYVAPYPRLAAFLAQHPEVAHNPVFFLGDARFNVPDARGRAFDMMEGILGGMAGLTVFGTIVGLIIWVVRSVISYRSWKHIVKIQTEAHTKIFDRLGSNEDLMAYIQSPAGQRFLTSTSTAVDLSPRSVGAPVGRILWSVQAGIVVTLAGVGLFVAKGIVVEEVAQVLHVISVLAMAIGIGFVVSALVAYALSQRLGLLEPPRTSHA
jgi:hypothetical protein